MGVNWGRQKILSSTSPETQYSEKYFLNNEVHINLIFFFQITTGCNIRGKLEGLGGSLKVWGEAGNFGGKLGNFCGEAWKFEGEGSPCPRLPTG